MSYSTNSAFSKDYNKFKSAQDHINRKKAETIFSVAKQSVASNTKQDGNNYNEIFTKSNGFLASVGGYNVSTYDLLLNVAKGQSYSISPCITISGVSGEAIDSSCNLITSCRPPDSAYEIFEAQFLTNAGTTNSGTCTRVCLSKEALYYTNYDPSNISQTVNYPFTQLVNSDKLRHFNLTQNILIECDMNDYFGTEGFMFVLDDTLWSLILSTVGGSDASGVPVIPNSMSVFINNKYSATQTRVRVVYTTAATTASASGFTMNTLLGLLQGHISTYNIEIIQWGNIPFATGGYNFSKSSGLVWSGKNNASDTPLFLSGSSLANCFYNVTIPSADFGNIGSWDVSMVQYFTRMFASCTNFTGGGISSWNMTNAIQISYMFQSCTNFNQDLSSWSNYTKFQLFDYAFSYCPNFIGTGLPSWKTSKVTNMNYMFDNCTAFNQDISAWDISGLTLATGMLDGSGMSNQNYTLLLKRWAQNTHITSGVPFGALAKKYYQWGTAGRGTLTGSKSWVITDGGLDSTQIGFPPSIAALTNWAQLFINGVGNAAYPDIAGYAVTAVSDFTSWISTNVTSMSEMFRLNPTFVGTGLTNWNVSNVTSMFAMFTDSSGFNIDLNWNPVNVTDMNAMFNGTAFNKDLSWNTSSATNMLNMFRDATAFNGNLKFNTINVQDMGSMFMDAHAFNKQLTWNTSNVTTMYGMFSNTSAVNSSFDSSLNFDTGNVIYMTNMFRASGAGINVFNKDLSWNTINVVAMDYMFSGATLFNGNISNWNTSNVANMEGIFFLAYAFNRNISGWNTINVNNMKNVFNTASSFNQNIGNWNTSNVTTMDGMFASATLFNQDISAWNISSLTTATNMLDNCGMSSTNYSNLLIGWAAQAPSPPVILGAVNMHYSAGAAAARTTLTVTYGWTIVGDTTP